MTNGLSKSNEHTNCFNREVKEREEQQMGLRECSKFPSTPIHFNENENKNYKNTNKNNQDNRFSTLFCFLSQLSLDLREE